MASIAQGRGPAVPARAPLESGPFVLQTLLQEVPLSADGGDDDVRINCVDYLDGNLYVGTSAAELLHFVQIPPDPSDRTGSPTFIIASRLQPTFFEPTASSAPGPGTSTNGGSLPGVQQILLLPRVGKACVLCNYTVTFYSLPELSPVFDGMNVKNCNWIGGIDLNDAAGSDPHQPQHHQHDGRPQRVTILLSLGRRIQPVSIGDEAIGRRKIDFAGSKLSVRRDSIACVADSRTYALVDVDRQLKIPLMSISSLDSSEDPGALGQVQSIASNPSDGGGLSRSASSAQPRTAALASAPEGASHSRSTSLGDFIPSSSSRKQPDKKPGDDVSAADDAAAKDTELPGPSRSPAPPGDSAPKPPPETDKPLPPIQAEAATMPPPVPTATKPAPVLLKPLIVSPTPEEFLLVTGTAPLEPGIGMFVNLDGDPTRPTLEFDRYPHEIVVDGGSADFPSSTSSPEDAGEEGYVLASMEKEFPDGAHQGLEIQRWDINVGEDEPSKYWLDVRAGDHLKEASPKEREEGEEHGASTDDAPRSSPPGIRSLVGSEESVIAEVVERLCQRRFFPFANTNQTAAMSLRSVDSRTALSMEHMSTERDLFERDLNAPDEDEEPLPDGWEAARDAEEEDAAARLARATLRLAVWAGRHIWWAARNPLLLRLEAGLEATGLDDRMAAATAQHAAKDRRQLFSVLNSFRGRDARTELEFRTFSYVRQRAGVLLFCGLLHPSPEAPFSEPELRALEEVLLEGGLDPRVVLALVPGLRHEIIEGRRGIWIFGGVRATVERYLAGGGDRPRSSEAVSTLDPRVLQFLRRFLTACRRRKGFGSVPDEREVSRTVDASLLAVLLELDKGSPPGLGRSGSVRAEINELVDHGVDCFERAVDLLESYNRLYVLSRLYQSRKMAGDVLATWRRIVEGEPDEGGELQDGEQRVREYLSKVGNPALVREYGIWLAARNPRLGVQVFADDKSRAPRPPPAEVVALLREEAPGAVKYYLEHLVFDKGHTAHVGELVGHYLEVVAADLETSAAARENVRAMYEAYRALRPPKPTFRRFLTDNAPPNDEVWNARLRLLQLLGGPHEYDVAAVRERITRASGGRAKETEDGVGDDEGEELLVPETIILDGRQGRHAHALRLLVHHLGDYDTAVLYCLRRPQPQQSQQQQSAKSGPKDLAAGTDDEKSIQEATQLFRALLGEFLSLEDVSDRIEQTGQLLERFGAWFDVLDVLPLIPDDWAVDASLAAFLASALRRLVRERHEAMVARALGSAENLRVNCDLIDRIREKGPSTEVEN